MRVASDTPMKNGGYLHKHPGSAPPPQKREAPPAIHVAGLINQWKSHTFSLDIVNLSTLLGVSPLSLSQLECCWAEPHKAWAFPMHDGEGNLVGIRLRSKNGRKWAVRGSHQGIFYADGPPEKDPVLVCEGPTDTAAALTLGFYAVGRPSCSGGVRDTCVLVRRLGIRRVVIIADNDKPGLAGAEVLQNQLPCSSGVLVLPTKDMREFVNQGGTAKALSSLIKTVIWKTK